MRICTYIYLYLRTYIYICEYSWTISWTQCIYIYILHPKFLIFFTGTYSPLWHFWRPWKRLKDAWVLGVMKRLNQKNHWLETTGNNKDNVWQSKFIITHTIPWDDLYIYLHEWLIFYGFHVEKYTIHGLFGSYIIIFSSTSTLQWVVWNNLKGLRKMAPWDPSIWHPERRVQEEVLFLRQLIGSIQYVQFLF